MNISKNFTLDEVQHTNTGINNVITDKEIMLNVQCLCNNLIQPARDYMNIPFTINSWYRSSEVNAKVGGVNPSPSNPKGSQHLYGEAVDISCSDLKGLFHYIKDNMLFDQLIWEFGKWIHVSYKRLDKNRNQILIARKVQGRTVYDHYLEKSKL